MNAREYKELKGLRKESLRDNMTNVELALNTLAEALHTPVYKLMSVLVELDCKKVISTLPGCRYTLI